SRIIFQEEEQDLLFVLTVDKRMDIKDTNEILKAISKRFFEKYGELRIDGLILTDFEKDATEIIYKKLWYLTTQERKFRIWDYFATVFVTLALCWYSLLLFGSPPILGMPEFDIKTFVWESLLLKISDPGAFVLQLLFLVAVIAVPAIGVYLLFKFTHVKDIFRFPRDYLSRPSRASYSELLPNYFLFTILVSFLVYVSFMAFGGGFFSELTVYPLYPGGLYSNLAEPLDFTNIFASDIGDQFLIGTISWFTWVFVFPLIYSLLLGEKKWLKVYRNSVLIASITIFILIICYIFAGVKYLEAVGFHPTDPATFRTEQQMLTFQLLSTIPLNIFFYGFLLFLGIGVSKVAPSKTRIPSVIALGIGIYATLILQRLVFFALVAPA
ncbi:MAG: hypothetical protein H7647_10140, partial [Candidatus Heimdallarchaeota archaeon]|nr:hypothetical protein [Candidatus Heimdallarchaeota archaeon]MCK4254786.1 hypothetical protein [Candidatus Heimdallarchaeota archaeon]